MELDGQFILNPMLEIGAGPKGTLLVRLPLFGRAVPATAFQVRMLHNFAAAPASPEEVLGKFPFDVEASRAFLERCVEEGALVEQLAGGKLALPDRMLPPLTFCSTPAFEEDAPAALTFLGVSWDQTTSGMPGARFGPQAVRLASQQARYRLSLDALQPEGFFDHATGRALLEGIRLADAGDVFHSLGEPPESFFRRVTDVVRQIRRAGSIPMIVGGDHSISYAVLRAFDPRHLAVIHLDAHTDLGGFPGAPMNHGSVFTHVLQDLPHVEGLYQVGLRGITGADARAEQPRVFQMGLATLREKGLDAFVAELPEHLDFYLSLDVDVVDPSFAPATGTPVVAGLYPHELKSLLRSIGSQRSLVGWDIVEVGSPSSAYDATAPLALECLLTLADAQVEYVKKSLEPEEGQP